MRVKLYDEIHTIIFIEENFTDYAKKLTFTIAEVDGRRIEKEQSNSTRKSSSSINSKDGLLSDRTRDNQGFISNGTSNSRRYNNHEKESARYTGKVIKGQYTNERGNEISKINPFSLKMR